MGRKIIVEQLCTCEVEIPDDYNGSIKEYIDSNIYTPIEALDHVSDMTCPFYDGYKDCPKWEEIELNYDELKAYEIY